MIRRSTLAVALFLVLLSVPSWSQVPTPVGPPVPTPDVVPKAALVGTFWPSPDPNPPPGTPLGMIVLSASGSASTRPIKWSVAGPAIDLMVMTPDGGLARSRAEAYPTVPGSYTFKVVAVGSVAGEPDADAATWTCTVAGGPTPITPTPVQPVPVPIPVPPKRR